MEKSKIKTQNPKLINISNRIIKYLYFTLFFLTPLVMVSFTSELFEFNKMILIYLITILITFFWLLKMIFTQKIIIKKTAFDIPIFLFLLSQLISSLFSIDRHTSIYGYYGRFNGGLISILSYVFLYYGFVSNINYETDFKQILKMLKISLLSSFLVILWGIPGKFGHDLSCLLFLGQFNNSCWTDQFRPAERMFSTLGQPNWLGAYLTINFFIGVYFFLETVIENKKYTPGYFYYGGYLLLNFIAILFTRSRSALFAVMGGIGLIFIFSIIKLKKTISKRQFGFISIILLGFFISVLIFKTGIEKIDKFISPSTHYKATNSTSSQVEYDKTQQIDVTTSADIRKIVWKGAINLGLKYPLFGTGVETFAYSYYFVRPKEHNLTSEWDFLYNKAHNEYLNYFATTGFIGLGAYLFLISSVLTYTWNKLKTQNSNVKLHLSLIIAWITILITNFFGFSTSTINLYFYLIPALIFIKTSNNQSTIPHVRSGQVLNQNLIISGTTWLQKILILILISSTFYLLLSLSEYYLADTKYASADSFSRLGEYQKAAKLLNEAYNLRYEHVYEDKLSYVLANVAFIAAYQKEDDIAQKMRSTADDLNLKSLNASAKNVLYWKTRAKNFYLFYQISSESIDLNQGIKALQEAEKISPTDPKIPYSLAVYYSLLEDETGDENEKSRYQQLAIFEVDQSIKLKTNFRDAYFLKGTLLKKVKKYEAARREFEYILNYINSSDEEVKKELESL